MPKRALIVIDVQNEYFDGALPISDPPTATSLANIGRAMDAATEAGVPVIVVRHGTKDASEGIFLEGSHAWELHPEIERRPRDFLIDKTLPGSFTDTDLGSVLEQAGVDTTSRQAAHRGLGVEILNDATGTLSLENSGGSAKGEELHRSTLVAQGQFFADVLTTDDWVGRIEA